METIELPTQSAFGFGSDVWILPDPQSCGWTRKIDWYLNGLVSKAESRTPLEMPLGLRQIIKEEELELPQPPEHDGMLMVSSSAFLPCERVIVQQFSGGLKAWLKKVIDQACKSGPGNLRIFLPPSESFENAKNAIKEMKHQRVVYVVADLTVSH